jgi:hypothetical protein
MTDTATHKTTTAFVVTQVQGNARGGTSQRELLDVVQATTPEDAVRACVADMPVRNWKFHEDSRTNTYVRLENPISFVSDRIDYISASAGDLVRNDSGQIQFSVSKIGFDETFRERVIEQDTIWATNGSEALKASRLVPAKGCSVDEAKRYCATASCKNSLKTEDVSYRATAVVKLTD